MKILELLEDNKGNYVDFEIYVTDFSYYHGYHGDFNNMIDDYTDTLLERDFVITDINYDLMNEEEYNHTIYVNSMTRADFNEWYGNKNAKILIVQINKDAFSPGK